MEAEYPIRRTTRCSPGHLRRTAGAVRTPGHLPRPQVLGLRLTRLACGKLKKACPPECARMSGPLPEPPGS
jgi:hypothetical protein